jgi:CubicO group peptidase (beta-lactamase class C family)
MDSATFLMGPEQRATSTPIHVKTEDGTWVPTEIDWNQNPDYFTGGHGLYCTPRDYLKFQRMLLGGGALNGTRILEQATVEAAFTNQIGDLTFPEHIATADPTATCDFTAGPGWTWGHGLLLNTFDLPGMRAAYSGAWAGLCNTHFWVDPTKGITGAIYTQFLPFVTPEAMGMYQAFEQALYASRT